jgi:hypothetical protein
MTEIVERLRATVSPLCHNAAATIEAQAAEIERLGAKCDTLEKATAHEWFCNQLGEIGFVGIRDYAALQARAEQAEQERDAMVSDVRRVNGQLADEMAARRQAERALAEAVEVLRPFAKAGELFGPRAADDYDQRIYGPAAGDEYALCGDHLRAARAFVAQHGSDSSTER